MPYFCTAFSKKKILGKGPRLHPLPFCSHSKFLDPPLYRMRNYVSSSTTVGLCYAETTAVYKRRYWDKAMPTPLHKTVNVNATSVSMKFRRQQTMTLSTYVRVSSFGQLKSVVIILLIRNDQFNSDMALQKQQCPDWSPPACKQHLMLPLKCYIKFPLWAARKRNITFSFCRPSLMLLCNDTGVGIKNVISCKIVKPTCFWLISIPNLLCE